MRRTSTRSVLVLTNRTQLAWLAALENELRDKHLVTVVVTAIGISPTLSWLWKRQWIDFRRCASADDSKRQSPLPVPRRWIEHAMPLRPALAHHLLCSMAGLGLVGANIVAEAQQSDIDTLGLFTGISTYLLLWLAWRFAGRRVSQNLLSTPGWRWVGARLTLCALSSLFATFKLKVFPRIIPAAIFLMAAPFTLQLAGDLASRSGFRATSRRRCERKNCSRHRAGWWTASTIFSLRRRLDVALGRDQIRAIPGWDCRGSQSQPSAGSSPRVPPVLNVPATSAGAAAQLFRNPDL